jgi:hypothetical protein
MQNLEIRRTSRIWFGADPELFVSLDGKIIGSEHFIPDKGVFTESYVRDPNATYYNGRLKGASYQSYVDNTKWRGSHAKTADNGTKLGAVRDGVQVELTIPASDCRRWFAMEIGCAFRTLKKRLDEMQTEGKKFELSFRQVIEVDKEELAKLSADSRVLGCQPSFNFYEQNSTIGVDPATYTKRSAGGHLHFGLPKHLMPERDKLPILFDIILGNTSVLIDRDPNAAERRKVYGRAGEFRRPRHGIEYRTLSNFWLRSKELVGLVTGLGRLAIWILDSSVEKPGEDLKPWPADKALVDLVNVDDIRKAINTNDLDLAKRNFENVRKFIARHVPRYGNLGSLDGSECALERELLPHFDVFVKGIDEGGIQKWFPQEPLEHWLGVGYNSSWEHFLLGSCAK